MALTPTVLTASGSSTDASSYNTASVSPTANVLTLVFVSSRTVSGTPNTPTVSGASMTWTSILSQNSLPQNTRITAFRSVDDAPSSGALTIDFTSQTQQGCQWAVISVTGSNISGTNGSGAIVQTGSTQPAEGSTAATVTLSAIASSANATFGGFGNLNGTISPGSGFTELAEVGGAGTMQVEWQLGSDNTVNWTYIASNDNVGIAFEVKAAPTGIPLSMI